jgi:hypothetical protein
VPATVEIKASAWYNNNDVVNLNKWPIKNTDADYGVYAPASKVYKWQIRPNGQPPITPERRPACLTDALLFKCFHGITLKPYEIVFVEVVWKWFANRVSSFSRTNKYWEGCYKGQWGYDVNQTEWWSPAPFKAQTQKGRIYRIGKLETNTGIGGYDTVTFAQRTRIITTKYTKGGYSALE